MTERLEQAGTSASKKAALAKLLAQAKSSRPAAPKPRTSTGPVPMSAQQRTLWITDQIDPGTAAYNVPYNFHIRGPLNSAALATALELLMKRHSTLQTYFEFVGEAPMQEVDHATPVPLELCELTDAEEVMLLLERSANTGFDLSRAPLWRSLLIKVNEHEYWLQIVLHHIITDGSSASVFYQDLRRLYAEVLDGKTAAEPASLDYMDYSEWQRERIESGQWDEHLDYWRDRLEGMELMQVVSDRPLPARYTFNGSTSVVNVPGAKKQIDAIAQRYAVSSFTAHFATLAAALTRYCLTQDVVVGIPTANRPYEELDEIHGYFVNMLPIRIPNRADSDFLSLVQTCKTAIQEGMSHAEIPLEKIAEVAKIPRDASRAGIFQTGMTVVPDEQSSGELFEYPDLEVTTHDFPTHTARYQLSFSIRELGDDIQVELEYSSDLFEPETARNIVNAYFAAAAHFAAHDGTAKIDEVPLLDAEAQRRELAQGVAEPASVATDPVETFLHQTQNSDSAHAVVDENGGWSYRELSAAAESLRARLNDLDLDKLSRVAVLVHRTALLPAAYLAILAAGHVIVPLDPSSPPERTLDMISDSGAAALIISPELISNFGIHSTLDELADSIPGVTPLFTPHRSAPLASASPLLAPGTAVDLDSPAYVLYTSGSTGKPKGVIVSRRNLSAFVANVIELFELNASDRILGYASVGFDVSMFELFSGILSGASVHYVRSEDRLDMTSLARFIREHHITVTDLPPSVMSLLDPEDYGDLRIVFVGGEAFSYELVNRWAPGRRFFNGYGPTECTVTMITHECVPGGEGLPPIGQPMRGHVAHVLDAHGRLQAPGLIGELAVGGVGLAAGYLNRPEAQEKAFIKNAFGTTEDGRLYLTGDFVRRNVDGDLVYVGRRDSQVKIGGVRIELGEVEAQLRTHPRVRQCHVHVGEVSGNKRLDAYVVPSEGETLDFADLRDYMAKRVMPAMVPGTITIIDHLPLNASGKVDFVQLPEPRVAVTHVDPPRTESERRLLEEVYMPILGATSLSVTTGFFDAGGTSLQAARLLARIRKVFDTDISLGDFFADSTPRTMAVRIDRAQLLSLPEDELAARLESMTEEEAALLLGDS